MWEVDYKEAWVPNNWCFWTVWCWRRFLRVPWTERRSSQSILKEISPECSLEGLMLKLKLQYWPPDVKNWLIWKDPDAGKDWGQEKKRMTEDAMVGWHHWLDNHELVSSRSWWWTEKPGVLQSMVSQRVRYDWATELNWPIINTTSNTGWLTRAAVTTGQKLGGWNNGNILSYSSGS